MKARRLSRLFMELLQGARLHITGRLLYGEVVDKAGVRRTTTTIACEDIIYLTRKM